MAVVLALFGFLSFSLLALADSTIHQVDAESSYIHVYTDTDGFVKALSHKYLISLGELKGRVYLDGNDFIAELWLSPITFSVDDDKERQRAVDQAYRDPVEDWIKIGTKINMNSSKLLAADIYPKIEVRIQVSELVDNPLFLVDIKIKAKTFRIQVPG